MPERYGDIWVCTDCYFAHHYGAFRAAMFADGTSILWDDEANVPEGATLQWFAGDSDTPCDREPMGEIDDGFHVADNTCANHYYGQSCETDENVEPCDQCGSSDDENGIQEFSWSRCHGCGSLLGGQRHRLSLWKENAS